MAAAGETPLKSGSKILIIGSGPIVIGQACEFDYSGTQACKALRENGYKVVLVNSNPATIMTDPVMADATYIEPLNLKRLTQIIEAERPDGLLPNLGGQTGLNLACELNKAGILEKYGVKVIGVNLDAIERGEDREVFKETMTRLGVETPRSDIAWSVKEAEEIAKRLNYPVVVRPAYTMGGAGGGLVYNVEELRTTVGRGLELSLTHQCLIEESILGWEELEVEVVRDSKNQMIAVCFIENIDAVGVHTGDSFCAAPFLTISKELEERLRETAFKIVESIGVIGGTNVQFAHDPESGRVVIIEINPRTSRSSALASKATGFPIALISAKLAAGMTLDQFPYWRDGSLEKYTPSGDYVVLKFARWAFEKFRGVEDLLGTQMKAVGEVMAIGKTFKETFQKAIRGLENGRSGLGFAKDFHERPLSQLLEMLKTPSSERYFQLYEAIRKGAGEKLKNGQQKRIICRYTEFNILRDSVQTTNNSAYWQTNPDIMDVTNTYGTFTASFNTSVNGGGVMYQYYGSKAVPAGWLVPLTYINIGRQVSEDEEIAKVRLIVPHSQGHSDASSNVYPCFYEITYQEMRN